MSSVRARYAPSPSGALHLGNARTALLSWLDARSLGGTFALRMEDLDPQRSLPSAAQGILDDLRWLGLDWDGDVVRQSDRGEIYRDAIAQLLRDGRAFECSCSRAEVARAANAPHAGEDGPRYPGTCRTGPARRDRPLTVRLRVDPGPVRFDDLVCGPQSFDVSVDVGDFVIRRGDGVAAYQLAVAVDDAAMGMTRVIRGDDLLSSTPRQLLVYLALNLTAPQFGHVPLILGEDGHRLAKRGGSLTLAALRERGVRPEVVVSFLARTAGIDVRKPVRPIDLVPGFRFDALARSPVVVTERDLESLR